MFLGVPLFPHQQCVHGDVVAMVLGNRQKWGVVAQGCECRTLFGGLSVSREFEPRQSPRFSLNKKLIPRCLVLVGHNIGKFEHI